MVVRPSPYICAEWEFGGLPYWLLADKDVKIRSSDPLFLERVNAYYKRLLPILTPLQWDQNGPIIMMQLENEYGSFGNDKVYLEKLYQKMRDFGVTVPIFTSDGAWNAALTAGSLLNNEVFPTGNFGSNAIENVKSLKNFMQSHNIKAPIMCMEFWDGWFNRWGEEIIKRDPEELRDSVEEMLSLGSLNLYMFQGGTNFGFMNGCSARGNTDLHQVTSYDYDAPLTEWGDKTKKYFLLKELFGGKETEVTPDREKIRYETISKVGSVSLFNTIDTLTIPIHNTWTLPMEDLNQGYGYILYVSNIGKKRQKEKLRVIEASDRIQIFTNKEKVTTQLKKEIGNEITIDLNREDNNELAILVENMGRVNYGSKLLAPTQKKGIRNGVMLDIHFHSEWDHYNLDLENINKVDFSKGHEGGPAFHKFILNVEEAEDTFIDCRGFGKGCMFVNGFNLGRYWEIGPINYLYLPGPLLRKGENEIVIFETEDKYSETLSFSEYPIYSPIGQ